MDVGGWGFHDGTGDVSDNEADAGRGEKEAKKRKRLLTIEDTSG